MEFFWQKAARERKKRRTALHLSGVVNEYKLGTAHANVVRLETQLELEKENVQKILRERLVLQDEQPTQLTKILDWLLEKIE